MSCEDQNLFDCNCVFVGGNHENKIDSSPENSRIPRNRSTDSREHRTLVLVSMHFYVSCGRRLGKLAATSENLHEESLTHARVFCMLLNVPAHLTQSP